MNEMGEIKVVLLDIEGTTTSISFVKDILFPYARQHMKSYLESHLNEPEVQQIIQQLCIQSELDRSSGKIDFVVCGSEVPGEIASSASKYMCYLMDGDVKFGGLKKFQGLVWRDGYATGKLQGHVFEDVEVNWKRWENAGKKMGIYSSGSVEAQILLFKNSIQGDLTKYLSTHFDTEVGMKGDSPSYQKISERIGVCPNEILFLTDIPNEGYAAEAAGVQVIIIKRPGNANLSQSDENHFKTAQNFNDILKII